MNHRGVDVKGTRGHKHGGHPGSQGTSTPTTSGASAASGGSVTSEGEAVSAPSVPNDVTLTAAQLDQLAQQLCAQTGRCIDNGLGIPLEGNLATPGPSATPGAAPVTVTISDVARFLPANATLHVEPAGWAVTGVPSNLWVDVTGVTVSAPLLGTTASVRFTPEAYVWSYGDGATRTTATPGASWASLGQEELTATATGHVYTARGAVQAGVTVVYTAEYRIAGGGWVGIAGAVEGGPPTERVLVVNERTVLTDGDGG